MFLNNHSYYSLRYGTLSEVELLELAKQYGCKHLPLTDINNTSGCLNFIRKARDYGIQPIVGIDFRNDAQQCYVGLAKNNEGFFELNTFLSQHLYSNLSFPGEAPVFENSAIIYPFEKVLHIDKNKFLSHEFIGVTPSDINKLHFSKLSTLKDRLVVLHTVTFNSKRHFNTHRLLRAIDTNELLSKLPKSQEGLPSHQFMPITAIEELFKDYPYILANTQRLLESCSIAFDFGADRENQNLKTVFGSLEADEKKLIALCEKGLTRRYPEVTIDIRNRIKKEIDLIKTQQFVSFFLINWKIVSYAREKGYFHVGRGSGANSIVAYLLGITDVDPMELDLYFERFMNLYRTSPPDFDIDFSTWDREDVTRFIFEAFDGNQQVALLGSYVTFQYSGAVRELGKVFGLPKYEIDRLSDGKYNSSTLDDITKLVLRYAGYLHGKPNYISIHAGGVLISDTSIHYYSATNLPPKGFPTVQFDMHVAEDVGLYKFDILGQRGLGKIKDAAQIVQENHPEITLPDIHEAKAFFTDDNINTMISRADCIGCFYVESPAMRMLLKKLAVNDYLTLVAASSIIRPGVAQSGMMREYILRHRNPERRKQAHPILWDIMPDTYGIMVYQEDVIKVAHHYAKLTLGEADVLRRGMSGKYRSREEFQAVRMKFITNCRNNGEKEEVIHEVWRQIESFAGYAFAKGHSASYAVESYQSLFFKCYYPLEYMVATVNNGGGFYSVEIYFHEAKMKGGIVQEPCINTSNIKTTIRGKEIYMGFQHLQGLEKRTMINLINARIHDPFLGLEDFMERVNISLEQLDILIRINAFRFTGKDKRSLLWEAHHKWHHDPLKKVQQALFKVNFVDYQLPTFTVTPLENAFDQLELLGFTLELPFVLLKELPTSNALSKDYHRYVGKVMVIYGYLVTIKRTKTTKREQMYFGTFLDQEGQWVDTVHFPPVAKKHPFTGKGIYRITGKVVCEFDAYSIEVTKLERMPYVSDARFDVTYNRKAIS